MSMVNLNAAQAGVSGVSPQVAQSQDYYSQALQEIYANIHHYPNGQLIGHSGRMV